ncbi:hypothetical protein BDM02DRAFT_3146978 [Thelephora ganbajun]|uniref:Uncharacterized protein n=1 Tax=Thelephora ganbajun TaxID=370292 RepID=A0ACB6ZBX5_THEGA|nr:hypothetical protein BDM02DRAFT_3146978 [Thelephora ganbajun]
MWNKPSGAFGRSCSSISMDRRSVGAKAISPDSVENFSSFKRVCLSPLQNISYRHRFLLGFLQRLYTDAVIWKRL